MESEGKEFRLSGIGVAPGIVIGPAFLYSRDEHSVDEELISSEDVDDELQRFERAVAKSERDLNKIIDVTRRKLGESSATIFEAQLMMLRDRALYEEVGDLVRTNLHNAAFAVTQVMEGHRRRMEASDSEYLRERSADLLDVQERLIRHLRRGRLLSAVDPDSIVISENLTAADVVLFSRRGILGCVTEFGGATSHVSIMARALALPAVVSTHGVLDRVSGGSTVIVDGLKGEVIVDPLPATREYYQHLQERYKRLVAEQKQLVDMPAETVDGHRVCLRANLDFRGELDLLKESGAEGIGLLRTEVLLLMEGRIAVDEEEQFAVYRSVLEAVGDNETTFRVLDLGGDKMLPIAHREHNPFLGWRGIRVLLDKPDLLEPQLRAILRASAFGKARILVPMVSSLSEVRAFRNVLERVSNDLKSEQVAFDESIPVGVMVEVPSVALMAESYAREVDFFSIGTNDLTQYVLAVDRGNDMVADLYHEIHPAVLRLMKITIDAGKKYGIPVALCGEMGSNSAFVPLLIGLGLEEISASPVYLPEVKRVVRALTHAEARELAELALAAPDARAVNEILKDWLEAHPLDLLHFLERNNSSSNERIA